MNTPALLTVALAVAASVLCLGAPHSLDACNVVWSTPSTNASGSMPLGNGDLALNLWVEADGDLLFYISKSDARDHKDELLKLGRVRVHLEPNPFRQGAPFHQELKLRTGEIAIRAGEADAPVGVRVWVDAHRPVVHVELAGRRPFALRTELEVWRAAERVLSAAEASGADQFAADEPHRVYPDTVLGEPGDAIVWYHRNERSIWPATLEHQDLESLIPQFTDPLLGRTFGGVLRGTGLVKTGATTLQSERPGRRFAISIVALTAQTDSADAWTRQLDETVARAEAVSLDKARAEHADWWAAFWERSWIRVTGSRDAHRAGGPAGTAVARQLERNELPLRLGADSEGANRFQGEIARATVFRRALTADEVRRLAESPSVCASDLTGCVAEWEGCPPTEGVLPSRGPAPLPMRVVGSLETVAASDSAGSPALRFSGQGFLEAAHGPGLDLVDAVTHAARHCLAGGRGSSTNRRPGRQTGTSSTLTPATRCG